MAFVNRFTSMAILGLFVTVLSTGCASLMPVGNSEIPAAVADSRGTYKVEMETTFGKQVGIAQLTGEMTIQQVLEHSGAIKKFRAMEIMIVRQLEGQLPLKMYVDFDSQTDEVKMHQNYAIHPNDHIFIKAKSNSPFDQFLGNFGGI